MKRINVSDLGALGNELAKYKLDRRLALAQFNQAARLAWLGNAVLSPVDAENPAGGAWLLYLEPPDGLAEQCVAVDDELLRQIHILDAGQGAALAAVAGEGAKERAAELAALNGRDFHGERFPGS